MSSVRPDSFLRQTHDFIGYDGTWEVWKKVPLGGQLKGVAASKKFVFVRPDGRQVGFNTKAGFSVYKQEVIASNPTKAKEYGWG